MHFKDVHNRKANVGVKFYVVLTFSAAIEFCPQRDVATPSNRVYSDNFGNNRIFKVMTDDSETVKVTNKRLKQSKAKRTV